MDIKLKVENLLTSRKVMLGPIILVRLGWDHIIINRKQAKLKVKSTGND